MATKKITELTAITSPDDADVFVVDDVSASETKKITTANLRASITANVATGPASATDNAVARFDGTTGKLIQNSAVTISDSGNIATSGTVDGRDLSVDGAKLDGIEAGADVTDAANVAAAGAVMTSRTISTTPPLTGGSNLLEDLIISIPPATASNGGYATAAQITKLDGIEALADVTDAANVAGAGAVMDSDFAGSATGTLTRTGAGTYAVTKDALAESGPPTESDDSSAGFSVGSHWFDEANGHVYYCANASIGGASWLQLDGAGGGGGSGDVSGPASATDNSIARFNLTTGKLIQSSNATIDDDGNLATSGTVNGRDIGTDGAKLDGIEAGADVTDFTNVSAAGAVMDADFMGSATGLMQRVGSGAYSILKENSAATSAPSATDDSSAGYAVGSRWIDVLNGFVYTCLDASAGSADWQRAPKISAAAPQAIGSASAGSSIDASAADHVHAHGSQAGGSLHSVAVAGGDAGFMSGPDKTKLDALAPVVVESTASTSITMSDADNNKLIECTASTEITVSIPPGLTSGVTTEYAQAGDGQIRLVGTGGLVLLYPASLLPHSKEKESTLVVTIKSGSPALARVRGHMESA